MVGAAGRVANGRARGRGWSEVRRVRPCAGGRGEAQCSQLPPVSSQFPSRNAGEGRECPHLSEHAPANPKGKMSN